MTISLFTKCLFEFIGTALLILLGDGVVASSLLKHSKGFGGGWVVITFAWGFAVMCGAFVAAPYSGAHLNPALSIGLALAHTFPWAYVPAYIIAQLAGGFLGAVLVYVFYKDIPIATIRKVTGNNPTDPNPTSGVFPSIARHKMTKTNTKVPMTSQIRLRGIFLIAGIVQKLPNVTSGSSVAS